MCFDRVHAYGRAREAVVSASRAGRLDLVNSRHIGHPVGMAEELREIELPTPLGRYPASRVEIRLATTLLAVASVSWIGTTTWAVAANVSDVALWIVAVMAPVVVLTFSAVIAAYRYRNYVLRSAQLTLLELESDRRPEVFSHIFGRAMSQIQRAGIRADWDDLAQVQRAISEYISTRLYEGADLGELWPDVGALRALQAYLDEYGMQGLASPRHDLVVRAEDFADVLVCSGDFELAERLRLASSGMRRGDSGVGIVSVT